MTVYKDLGEGGGVILNDTTSIKPSTKEDDPFCSKPTKKVPKTVSNEVIDNDS